MYDLVTVPFDDLKITLVKRGGIYKRLIRNQAWEPEVTEFLKAKLAPDMTFVDAGAQFGYYTLMASRRCKQVYAFEPRAEPFAVLIQNITQNGCRNVTTVNSPLFSGPCQLDLRSAGLTLPLSKETKPDDRVEAVTLDGFLNGKPVDFIKIDVEGAEFDILTGAQAALERCFPILVIEMHAERLKQFGHTEAQLLSLLEELGYHWQPLGSRHIMAERSGSRPESLALTP